MLADSAENLPVSIHGTLLILCLQIHYYSQIVRYRAICIKTTLSSDVSIYITGKSKNLAKICQNL